MKLSDKVVVITGSGGGIGEACARRFAKEGAKVIVTDIDSDGVSRVSDEIGTVGLAADITVEGNVRAVADLARRTYGDIDLWFSNAGHAGPPQGTDISDENLWDLSWRLHVMSHVYAARAVLPSMVERGQGYLLQTASVVALAMHPDKAAYSVTKHAALSLSEWLAATYRPKGIKVSCFCPGPMLTPMLLSDGVPAEHPIVKGAALPDEVADRLVHAIDDEKFLILDSTIGNDVLTAKAADYEQWISDMSALTPTTSPNRLRTNDMSDRFLQVTFSNPVEGEEDEFNEWYDNVHIPELLAIPGMLSATRYDLHDAEAYRMEGGFAPEHRYLTIYEMEGDVNAILAKIMEGVASGHIVMSDSLDLPSSRMSFWSPRGLKVNQ